MNKNTFLVTLTIVVLFLFIAPALSYYFLSASNCNSALTVSQTDGGVLKYEKGKLIAIIKVNVSECKFGNVFLVSASIMNTSYKYYFGDQNKIILTNGENTLIIPFNVSAQPDLQLNKTYFILITLNQGETFRVSAVYISNLTIVDNSFSSS